MKEQQTKNLRTSQENVIIGYVIYYKISVV